MPRAKIIVKIAGSPTNNRAESDQLGIPAPALKVAIDGVAVTDGLMALELVFFL